MNFYLGERFSELERPLILRIGRQVMLQIHNTLEDWAGIACRHIQMRRRGWVHINLQVLAVVQETISEKPFLNNAFELGLTYHQRAWIFLALEEYILYGIRRLQNCDHF
jgi:hypothetical protein